LCNDLAEQAGNRLSLNMVILGMLIGSDAVPIAVEVMRDTISHHTKKALIESNIQAFELGVEEGKIDPINE